MLCILFGDTANNVSGIHRFCSCMNFALLVRAYNLFSSCDCFGRPFILFSLYCKGITQKRHGIIVWILQMCKWMHGCRLSAIQKRKEMRAYNTGVLSLVLSLFSLPGNLTIIWLQICWGYLVIGISGVIIQIFMCPLPVTLSRGAQYAS
jgi:hypothetical protein